VDRRRLEPADQYSRNRAPVATGDVVYVTTERTVVAFDRHERGAPRCGSLASVALPGVQTVHNMIVDDGRMIATTDQGLTALGLG